MSLRSENDWSARSISSSTCVIPCSPTGTTRRPPFASCPGSNSTVSTVTPRQHHKHALAWFISACGGSVAAAPTWMKWNGASLGNPSHPSAPAGYRAHTRTQVVRECCFWDPLAELRTHAGSTRCVARAGLSLHAPRCSARTRRVPARARCRTHGHQGPPPASTRCRVPREFVLASRRLKILRTCHAPETRRQVAGAGADVQNPRLRHVPDRHVRKFERIRVLPSSNML